jgi:polyphosphate kinase
MERNLFKRVEIAFPLLDKRIRAQVTEQLMAYIHDSTQSWTLRDDGSYVQVVGGGKPVQVRLLEQLTGPDEPEKISKASTLRPRVAKPKAKKK